VVACSHPFSQVRRTYGLAPGMSLLEILAQVQPDPALRRAAHVWVGDDYIRPEFWAATFPPWGSLITVKVVPAGPVGRIIGAIFVAIAAIAAAVYIGPWLAGVIGFGSSALWGGLAALAVGIAGNLALNALIPPVANPGRHAALMKHPVEALGAAAESPSLSITGSQNQANPYGPVPKILGRFGKYKPFLAAETYTESAGDKQFFRMCLCWGFGPILLETLRLGDTALGQFDGVEIEHRNLTLRLNNQTIAINVTAKTLTRSEGSWIVDGFKVGATVALTGCTTPANNTDYLISGVAALVLTWSTSTATTTEAGNGEQTAAVAFGDEALTLYTNDIHEESLSILLERGSPVVRTTALGVREITVDITCPNGLTGINAAGGRYAVTAHHLVEYRQTDTLPWSTAGNIDLTGATGSQVRGSLRWLVNEGGDPAKQYDVRLTRSAGDPPDSTTIMTISYWTALRSVKYTDPIARDKMPPLALTALRIQASDQLSGVISDFSGTITGLYDDYDPETEEWVAEQPTQNPASLFYEVLKGAHKQAPLAAGRIDLEKIEYWWQYCDAQGWQYNKIMDYACRLREILIEIAAAGRAALSYLDSKISVIIDEPQEFTIGPAFTPRNSGKLSSKIVYPRLPHAFRVPFKNELEDWGDDERLILADGYQIDGLDAWGEPAPTLPPATLFEQLELPGLTHPELIFRQGRYHLAVATLRFVSHEFTTDIEWMVAQRGDRIKFAHDVILAGLMWGRVTELTVEGGNLLGVVVDTACPMEADKNYNLRFTRQDSSTLLVALQTEAGEQLALTFAEPRPPADPWPQAGNLFMFGEAGQEAVDLIIKSVTPNSQLGAKLLCVAYDEAIYTADEGEIPEHQSHVSIPAEWQTPEITNVRSDGAVLWRAVDGSWQSRILVNIWQPAGLGTEVTGIETQYWRADSLSETPVLLPVSAYQEGQVSIMPVEDGVEYKFRLRFIKKNNNRGPWTATQTHTVAGKTAPPADVTGLAVNQLRDLITASWAKVADLDLAGYECRYGSVGFPWAAANLVNGEYKGTTFTTTNIPPGTWDVMLKAMDTSGNYSETEARVTITVFTFYEILSEQQYAPLWEGTLTNYRRNPRTGYLNPVDQAAADAEGQELFEKYVIDPYDEAIYEGDEIDLGEDKLVRAWGHIDSNLGPGESGLANPEMWLRYKPDGGAYTDWLKWTIGLVEARYFKFRLRNLAAVGNVRVTGFKAVLDQPL
jgi:hypothetical protein